MKFVNLTPHVINIFDGNGGTTHVVPSGTVARCKETRTVVRHIGSIPVEKAVYGDVVGLPEPQEGTVLIVSMRTAAGVKDRDDVVFPGEAIRDPNGVIVGCRGLSVL